LLHFKKCHSPCVFILPGEELLSQHSLFVMLLLLSFLDTSVAHYTHGMEVRAYMSSNIGLFTMFLWGPEVFTLHGEQGKTGSRQWLRQHHFSHLCALELA
jgi:hypothetical protein